MKETIVEYGVPIDAKTMVEPPDVTELELEPGHPGIGDAGYVERRKELFALCRHHRLNHLGGRGLAWAGIIVGSVLLVLTPAGVWAYFYFWRSNWTPEDITKTYKNRVYQITTDSGSLGSGILIANDSKRGLVATNLHVIDKELQANRVAKKLLIERIPKVSVSVKNPTQLNTKRARVAAFHHDFDLALVIIEVDENPGAVPIVRKKALKQGEGAVALGNPLGLEFFTSSGIISSTSGERGYLWTTCPISGGNSGGPLFLLRRGLLAGINTGSLEATGGGSQNLNASVPAEEIVLSLRSRQSDWVWAPELKDLTLELAETIPLKED